MRAQHKKHFVVGGVDLQSNRVYGDYKIKHREFMLDDPNPPTGIKMDWNAGKAMILYVEKGKDGQFPDLVIDSMTVQRKLDKYKVRTKDDDGRIRNTNVADAKLFYGCKKCTAKEFAKLVGITKEADKVEDMKKKK